MKMNILIVDDDPEFRSVLKMIVEDYGNDVVEAGDGQEGFEKALQHKPDVIISDAMMPKMDGFQLLRAVRQDETLCTIPFVFLTSIYTSEKEYELALALGADALIVKSKDPADFWKEFTSALEKHKPVRKKASKAKLIKKDEEYLNNYSLIVTAKLEEKVEELERLQEVVINSSNEWRNTFDTIKDAICMLNTDGKILRCNKSMTNLLAKPFDEIVGKQCWEVIHNSYSPIKGCPCITAQKTLKRETIILPVSGKWFEVTVDPCLDNSGNFAGAVHIMTDVTEQKRNQETLSKSEQRYRNLVDDAQDVIFTLGSDGAVVSLNPVFETITGWSRTEIIGQSFINFVHPDDQSIAMDHFLRVMRGEYPPLHVLRILFKSGGYLYGEFQSRPNLQDGTIVGLFGIARDITERKRNEEMIREIALQQKAILSNIPDIAWLKDKESRFLAVNEPFGKACGVRPEDMGGKTDLDIWPKDLAERYRADDREVMESGKQKIVEEPLSDKEGKTAWIETIKTPIYNEKGEVIGTTGIARDITGRKQLEDALKEAVVRAEDEKAKTDSIIEAIGDGVTIQNREFRILYQNQSQKNMVGDHVGELCYMAYEKREQRCEGCPVAMVFEDGKVHITERSAPTDKGILYVEITASPLLDSKGNIIAGIEVVHNITERKHAEETLKESENKFRSLTEQALVGTYIFQDNVFKYVNPRFIEIFGYSAEELIDRMGPLDLTLPEDQALVQKNIRKRQSGEVESVQYEFRGVRKDGQIIHVELLGSNIMYLGRRAVIGTLLDITKRKLAEEQVFQITQEWEETFNTIMDMVTVHDKDYNIIRANTAAEKILGLPFLELKKVKCFDYYHGTTCPPEGCPSCQSLVTGKPSTSEMFEPHLNMYLEIRAIPRLDSNNQVVGLIHIVRDISERKKAADVLREERNKAQKYLDVAGVMIVALDTNARITLINKKGLEILGYEEHEVFNQNWFDLCIPGRVREVVKDDFNKLISGDIKLLEYYENPIITKDGKERMLAFHNAILRDVSGEISGTLSSGEDITERKKAEEALEQYSHELTELSMASDTLMLITNLKDIYEEICNIIYTVFDLKMVWLGVIDEGNYEVKSVAYAGHEDGYLSAIRVTWDNSPTGMGPTGMSIKGKTIFKENINDALFTPWKSEAQKRGYVDIMSVPLIYARDKCIGALTFYSSAPDYFTPDRIRLCQIFANQAAIAIENARLVSGLEVEVRKRTQALEDTNMELQQLNKELSLRREEADAASRSKTDFLANMSHELRTPLNAILGFSEIMQTGMAGPVTDKQKEFLSDIYTSGAHLLALITDILDLSKIEAGKMELEPGTFSLKELIEASLIMFKEKALKHAIKVTTEIDDTITGIVADQRKLKQVIVNLLSNAFKFTPDGGSVLVAARHVGAGLALPERAQQAAPLQDFIEISVSDTGIGISKEHQQKLFQPFQQIETSLTRKYAGTGLGLSLCRRFVELHGGRIWVESEKGKGSRFVFVIPMKQ